MNQSTINFLIKALGAEEAAKEIDKISRAAKKAGTSVKQYLSTASGSQRLLEAQTKAAVAQTEKQTEAEKRKAAATRDSGRAQESYFGHIAKTTVQSALINKLFLEFIDVSDQAIKQVDLMNNFPVTMASMGQSAEYSGEAFQKLRDYVGQVGGNLGQAASMVTRFTGVTKDVQASVAIFAGLNNALVAGDSNLQEQAQAAVQFAQAFERGKPDMKEWLSLTQNMSQQLNMVAREMGYVNATALGESLRDGEENMGAFTAKLTEMSTGMGPIAQQALARMQGMQFAFNVMKNTAVQGLASIIDAFGRSNIVSFFAFWTQVVQVLTQAIVQLIGVFFGLINAVRGLFGMSPLEGLKKDAVEVQDATEGVGDGLKGAKKDADKLNKALASFDKMNVLADKTSKKKDDDEAKGGTTFDAGQMDALKGAFDGITTSLQEVGIWAKIFAGFLASIAAVKIAQGLMDQFNGIIKSTETATKNMDKFKKALAGGGDTPSIFTKATTAAKALPASISGAMAGLSAVLLSPMGLVILAIAAVVASLVYLYNTNEDFKKGFDAVWGGFVEIVQNVAKAITESFGKAIEWVKTEMAKLPAPFQDAFKIIGDVFKPVIKFFDDLFQAIGLTGPPMEKFGQIIGGIAIAVGLLTAVWAIYQVVMIGVNIVTGIFAGIMSIVLSPITLIILAIAVLITIIALLIIYWNDIVKVATDVWNAIVDAWNAVGKWFMDNVVQPVVDAFTSLWNSIVLMWQDVDKWFTDLFVAAWNGIVGAWNGVIKWFTDLWNGIVAVFVNVKTWFETKFTEAWTAIKSVWGGVKDWFQTKWNDITGVFGNVKTWFETKFTEAWEAIKKAFTPTAVRDFFVGVWNKIVSIFGSIGSTMGDAIGNAFKVAVNGILGFLEGKMNDVVNIVNGAIGAIDSVTPGTLPRLGRVSLPRLARGGVVDQATIAMIGEEGKEAVVPLENNLEWIDKLAAKINTTSAGGQPVHLTIQIGEEKIATKVIDLINEQTQMSGRNKILV